MYTVHALLNINRFALLYTYYNDNIIKTRIRKEKLIFFELKSPRTLQLCVFFYAFNIIIVDRPVVHSSD